MRFIIWERSVQKKTDFWIVLCCILKEPKINMLEFSCWCKKIPNLSMKNYTQFHSFSLIKRVKYEMISPFSRNEKWKIFSLHSFREVKVKIKWLKIEIEKWKWKSNDSKSRSRSEFSKKISRILENRDSRWSLDSMDADEAHWQGQPILLSRCLRLFSARALSTLDSSQQGQGRRLPPLYQCRATWRCPRGQSLTAVSLPGKLRQEAKTVSFWSVFLVKDSFWASQPPEEPSQKLVQPLRAVENATPMPCGVHWWTSAQGIQNTSAPPWWCPGLCPRGECRARGQAE